MPLIDLSHAITDGMSTYPGLPGPQIGAHLTFENSVGHYAEGTEFSIGRITMVTNTGTYIDTPRIDTATVTTSPDCHSNGAPRYRPWSSVRGSTRSARPTSPTSI